MSPTSENAFAAELRRLRREHHLTVGAVAAQIGVSVSLLSKIGTGHRRVTPDIARRLDEVLDARGKLTRLAQVTDSGRATGIGVTPQQLPSAPEVVGRANEVRAICETAVNTHPHGYPHVIVIDGQPGAGKTALALHAASLARWHFGGGILFAKLRDPNPVSIDDVLQDFLISLGIAAPADTTRDARRGLYRTAVSDKAHPVLVVLDDAIHADQVLDLIPGSNATVIVTTSTYLGGIAQITAARRVTVPALTGQESRELLSRLIGDARIGSHSGEVESIIRSCRGIPAALSLVAEQVTADESLSLREVADVLDEPESAVSFLRPIGRGLSYGDRCARTLAALSDSAADTLRVLVALPALPLHKAAIIDASTTLHDRTNEVSHDLVELHQHHLIRISPNGVITMPPLVHAYLRTRTELRVPVDDTARARGRLYSWYAATAAHASTLAAPGWFTLADTITARASDCGIATPTLTVNAPDTALSWCSEHHDTVLALADDAATCGHHDGATDLALSLHPYYQQMQTWRPWLHASALAVERARASEDKHRLAPSLISLGWALLGIHRYDDARPLFDEAHALATGNTTRGWSLAGQGVVKHAQGDNWRALELLTLAEQAFSRLGLMGDGIIVTLLQSRVCHSLGDSQRAFALAESATRIGRTRGSESIEGLTRHTLGTLYLAHGQPRLALTQFDRAVALLRRFKSRVSEAETLIAQGQALQQLHRTDDARHSFAKAATVLERLRHPLAARARGLAATLGIAPVIT